jgi:hypothetical protein
MRPVRLPGETPDSWLEAVACRMNARPGDVLGLGLGTWNQSSGGLAAPADSTIALRSRCAHS